MNPCPPPPVPIHQNPVLVHQRGVSIPWLEAARRSNEAALGRSRETRNALCAFSYVLRDALRHLLSAKLPEGVVFTQPIQSI